MTFDETIQAHADARRKTIPDSGFWDAPNRKPVAWVGLDAKAGETLELWWSFPFADFVLGDQIVIVLRGGRSPVRTSITGLSTGGISVGVDVLRDDQVFFCCDVACKGFCSAKS